MGLAESFKLAWPQLLKEEVGSWQEVLKSLLDVAKISPGGTLVSKGRMKEGSNANWKCLILSVKLM